MAKETIVAVIDGGGRGSVLVDNYSKSPFVDRLLGIPGNDWMKKHSLKPVETFPELETTNVAEIVELCQERRVALVDVAQDNAVRAGLTDALLKAGIPVIGPTKEAGQIEWDKAWAREMGEKWGLPQPKFKVCHEGSEAFKYISSQKDQPWFIKAAYLAEGKGAKGAKNNEGALAKVIELREQFPDAAKRFLVEEWIRNNDGTPGEEFSLFVLADGKNFKIIGSAQDHKKSHNFDEGENTGGMGCSSPPLVVTEEIRGHSEAEIIKKTIDGLMSEGRPYKGILYLGGILTHKSLGLRLDVMEFNARWGDPEAQAIIPGIKNDLFEVGMAVAEGNIGDLKIKRDNKARIVVTGASRGYPGNYHSVKGKRIYGLKEAMKLDDVRVFGAGIEIEDNKHYASGGRLFYVVGEGKDVIEAREKAYRAMSLVSIDGNNLHFRTDIGWRDVERVW